MQCKWRIQAILFLIVSPVFAQDQDFRFEHISTEDGLSGTEINCIRQDKRGFIWIATRNGLNRYDGYKFRIYKHDPNDQTSISMDWIKTIHIDNYGNLWIGTNGEGLDRYDYESETFCHYRYQASDQHSLQNNYVSAIKHDSKNNLWIGMQNGFSRAIVAGKLFLSDSISFENYRFNSMAESTNTANYVFTFFEDQNNKLCIGTANGSVYTVDLHEYSLQTEISEKEVNAFWTQNNLNNVYKSVLLTDNDSADPEHILTIGTMQGIYKYDTHYKKIIDSFPELNNLIFKNTQDYIISYLKSHDGKLWLGTSNNGLFIVGNDSRNVIHHQCKYDQNYGISSNKVYTIYQDRQGIIWLGLLGGGVNKYNKLLHNFCYYDIHIDHIPLTIYAIHEDLNYAGRILWLGSARHGLIKYDRISRRYKQYKLRSKYPISAIFQDAAHTNNLLIASLGDGLKIFDITAENFISCNYPDFENVSKHELKINRNFYLSTAIKPGLNGKIWLGNLYGLYCFDPHTQKYVSDLPEHGCWYHLPKYKISTLEKSKYNSEDILWIGTRYGGLIRYNETTRRVDHYKHEPSDSTSLSSNYISSICCDTSGNVWIGTPKGLNYFDPKEEKFFQNLDPDMHDNLEIFGILQDIKENLWLCTKSSIYRYNPQTGQIRKYDKKNGLGISGFTRYAQLINNKNEIFIGGQNGFISFNPDSIKVNRHIPPVMITDFHIFNQPVLPSPDSPLQESISLTDKIYLRHDQSVFSFEFSALDYTIPQKNKYTYKMEGVDPDWVYTDASRRFATYTHLDPGTYTFRVKGSNNDGIWNEKGASVTVIITPPPWKTWYAYTLYIIIFIGLVYTLRQYDLKRQRLKHELELEHMHGAKLEEVDRMKSRFFANISHEFRTPLTLILGPVEQMLSGTFKGNLQEQYKLIIRNGRRLLQLINQLLDLAKLESNKLKLNMQNLDIVPLLTGLVESFESWAKQRNISLTLHKNVNYVAVMLDQERFEQIINNLLSNALKFTPEGGRISVSVEHLSRFNMNQDTIPPVKGKSGGVLINVTNSGPVIAKNHLEKIFDRFYQIHDSELPYLESTGIGLALVKELVELHHGSISVESAPDKGTIFKILLPVSAKEMDRDITEKAENKNFSLQLLHVPELKLAETAGHEVLTGDLPLILIVEDNADVRHYIRQNIKHCYRIIEAADGAAGIQKAVQKIPDLVISDVLMPGIDGYSLCRQLKSDVRTSHIPVILLTARAEKADKITGLETGADDYILKPFDTTELAIRINNLLVQRQRMQKHFAAAAWIDPEKMANNLAQKWFLNKVVKIIEIKISDPGFSVKQFSDELGLSRAQLHRKIKALTGDSPHMFIRQMRLKLAANLLKKRTGNISEIAYDVGFNSPSHFAKAFRTKFGMSPMQFMRKNGQ